MTDFTLDQALACEDLCRFLSACYYEPAVEFEQEQLFDSIVAAADRLDPALATRARQLREAFATQDLQTLLVDYSRLFIGPGQALAAPYASRWSGQAAAPEDDPLDALLACYAAGGFEIDAEFRDLPDHVAVELEFLYLLRFTQNQAELTGDAVAAEAAQTARSRFLAEHLGAWIGPFSAAVQAGAETPFYRVLGGLTEAFVRRIGRDGVKP